MTYEKFLEEFLAKGLLKKQKSDLRAVNKTSFARIRLATACPGSPDLWAGSFPFGRQSEVRKEFL